MEEEKKEVEGKQTTAESIKVFGEALKGVGCIIILIPLLIVLVMFILSLLK